MRVALLGPVHPYRGGIAHYTAALTGALAARGHTARVFNFTRQYPRLLFPGERQTDQSAVPLEVPAERVVDSLSPLSWWRTVRRVRRFAPDLLLVQWWHPFFAPSFGFIARRVRRSLGIPVVFLCHNVRPHEASRVDNLLLRYAYGAADAFLVQAEGEAEVLRSLQGDDVALAVTPHPTYDALAELAPARSLDDARAELGIDAPRLVLFFGLVRPYKGLLTLLDAVPLLDDPAIHVLVGGEFYDDPQPYLDRVAELGIRDRVTIHNRYIPNEEVATYFSAADLVALPYRQATGSGVVQLAWAYGVPVVVSAVGGIPEVVQDGRTGLLVPPDRPDSLARAIDRYFADNLAAPLRRGVAEASAENGWDRVVDAVEGFAAAPSR